MPELPSAAIRTLFAHRCHQRRCPHLTPGQREALEDWFAECIGPGYVRTPSPSTPVLERCRPLNKHERRRVAREQLHDQVVSAMRDGMPTKQAASRFAVHANTARKWRRLAGLPAPPCGRPRNWR